MSREYEEPREHQQREGQRARTTRGARRSRSDLVGARPAVDPGLGRIRGGRLRDGVRPLPSSPLTLFRCCTNIDDNVVSL